MTVSGCVECGADSYSEAGAVGIESCTGCPGSKTSPAGSTSVADCKYGNGKI